MKLSSVFIQEKQNPKAAGIAMGIFFCAAIAATYMALNLEDGQDNSKYVNQALDFSSYACMLWLWRRQIMKSNILLDYVEMLSADIVQLGKTWLGENGSGDPHSMAESVRVRLELESRNQHYERIQTETLMQAARISQLYERFSALHTTQQEELEHWKARAKAAEDKINGSQTV